MAKICPYCTEEQTALKNHVRLASGDGHGPSGQYPDDFERGPDRGGGDDDDEPGGTLAAPAAGGSGTVTVEAVEDAGAQEVPEYEEEEADGSDEENIVAMPESELNGMLQAARETVTRDKGGDSDEDSASTDETGTRVDAPSLDPDDVAEKADENGWGVGAVLLLFFLALAAGVAWSIIQNAAENARQTGHQLTQRGDPSIPGV